MHQAAGGEIVEQVHSGPCCHLGGRESLATYELGRTAGYRRARWLTSSRLEHDFRCFAAVQRQGIAAVRPPVASRSPTIRQMMGLLHAAPRSNSAYQCCCSPRCTTLLAARATAQELAAFYPNLTTTPADGDPFPAFRRVALANEDAVAIDDRRRAARRPTRSVAARTFLPVFGLVADEVGPLAHARRRYQRRPQPVLAVLRLSLRPRRRRRRAARRLNFLFDAWRTSDPDVDADCSARAIGLDISPIDVRDEEAVRWLEACVWPDQAERFERLVAAIAIARKTPPDVRQGDAVANVGALVDEVARSATRS